MPHSSPDQPRRSGRGILPAVALLIAATAASMLLVEGWPTDLAMGVALAAFVAILLIRR